MLLLFGQTAPLLGNPTGGQVAAGSATITNAGTTLNINQGSDKAIINWQSFSINSGEMTKFLVPTSSSATLNRVLGGNPSAIYGTLQSNGQLFLVNPSGIVVGAGGRIDTAGFLGSTLNVSDGEFLQGGDLHFLGTSGAGIDNHGIIHAASGDVYLIANQVSNSGTLSAPQGNVGLAAGMEVLLQQAGDQHLFVQPVLSGSSQATGVSNAGSIQAATAELKAAGGNAYALAINNNGNIAVTGFKKVNGQVYLIADGGNITNSGQISAQNPNGDGGTIVLNGHGTSSAGTVLSSGKLIASGKGRGTKGGTVQVLGNQVGITDQGVVDVSGDAGGGTALIGGDEHGANAAIPDAEQTYVGPDAQITADALAHGNGGKIILWGNETTQAYGKLSARGGALGGNGGFVETSAPSLDVQTVPDVGAPNGKGGTWLLDPSDISISDTVTTTPGFSAPFTIASGSAFNLNQADLLTALMGGNVTLDASGGSGGNGTITWTQSSSLFDISSISGNTLTLIAPVQVPTSNISPGIFLNGITIKSVSGTGSLNLVLNSSGSSSNVQIINATLKLNGGNLTAYGTGFASVTSSTSLNNSDGIFMSGDVIDAQGGNITLNGKAGYYFNNDPTINNVSAGYGLHIDSSVIQTSGAGSVNLTGDGSMPASGATVPTGTFTSSFTSMVGVAIYNGSTITADAGGVSITGTISQGTATGILQAGSPQNIAGGNLFGVDIEGGSQIASTGNGFVSIIGNTSGSTATVENTGIYITGGASNSNSSSSTPTTSVVTAAGGVGVTMVGTSGTVANSISGTNFQGPEVDGIRLDSGVSIVAAGSAPITLTGTGGADTNTDPTLGDGNAGGIEIDAFGNANGNTGNSSTTNDTISSVSGAILMTGTGGSSMRSVNGISINSSNGGFSSVSSTSGNITLNGSVPNQTVSQINNAKGGDEGVGLGGDNSNGSFSSVTALAGSINITGTVSSGTANSKEAGIVISGGSHVSAQGTGGAGALAQGDVTLIGNTTGSTAQSLDGGVFIEGSGTQVSATGTTANAAGHSGLTILGTSSALNGTTGATIDQHSNNNVTNPGLYLNPVTAGIALINGATLKTTGSATMTLTGTGGANTNTDPTSGSYGVAIFSPTTLETTGISAGTGLVSITGTAGSSPNAREGVLLGGPSNLGTTSVAAGGAFNATAMSGTGIYLNATVTAQSATLGTGSIGNPASVTSGSLQIQNANITLGGGDLTAYGAGTSNSIDGIDVEGSSINTQGGNIFLTGKAGSFFNSLAPAPGNVAGWGVLIGANSVLETAASNQNFTTGNITITGDGSQPFTVINDLTGVEITGSKLNVVDGAISIVGNVNSGTSQNITSPYVSYPSGVGDGVAGILVDGGSNIASSGTGSVSLVGNTTGAVSDASGSTVADHDNSGVHITGQNTTIAAASGGITIIGTSGTIINNPTTGGSADLNVSIGPFQSSGSPTLNAGTGSLVIDPLAVVAGSAINVVANVTAGTTTLSDPGQEADLFNIGSSNFGILNVNANTATIYQAAAINLGAVSVNNLTLITNGSIIQTGPITTSLLSAASGGSITLTNPGNGITQLGPINQTAGVTISSKGTPLVPTTNNGSQTFAINVQGVSYTINLNQVTSIPALGITIQPIGGQVTSAGGGTTTGQQIATILPVSNQVAPAPPPALNTTGVLVTDTSTLGTDVSYNPPGSTSPTFQNVSTLSGASSGDSDVGPGDVVEVGGGSVGSTKMPPAIAGALQGALNNQVRQDLADALQGH